MTDFKPFVPKERIRYRYVVGGHCQRLWEILPEIKMNIEKSPTKITSIRTNDFKKELGPNYKEHSDNSIFQISRYGLFEDGIKVDHTIIDDDDYLIMRNRKKEDTIPGMAGAKKKGYVCKGGKRIDP